MKKLFITIFLIMLATQTSAWVSKDFIPANVSQITVALTDNAKEGCWTNIGEVKRYTEDKLELLGFPVSRDKFERYSNNKHFILFININSERNPNLCYGDIQLEISRAIRTNGTSGMLVLGESGGAFSRVENANQGILERVNKFMKQIENPQG